MTAPVLSLPVKVLRSATAGRRPGDGTFRALTDGEIFINTQDRVLCCLDASGTLFTFPIDPAVLAALAPLASPVLTGSPKAPTAAAGDSSTLIATTAFVAAAITAILNQIEGGAPGALNTLKELADAINDDPNFTATMSAALANRVRTDAKQGLATTAKGLARFNAAASPFDAMAYRNLFINPRGAISQESGATARTAGGYVTDMVSFGVSGVSAQAAQVANPFPATRPDLTSGWQITTTAATAAPAAGAFLLFSAFVEGLRMRRLLFGTSAAVPIALGVLLKSSVAITVAVSLRNAVSNRSYVVDVALAANAETFVPLIVPGDTAGTWVSTNALALSMGVAAVVGSTYQTATKGAWQGGNYCGTPATGNLAATNGATLTMSELIALPVTDAGADVTTLFPAERLPFFYREDGDELALCERYLRRWDAASGARADIAPGQAYAATAAVFALAGRTPLRNASGCVVSSNLLGALNASGTPVGAANQALQAGSIKDGIELVLTNFASGSFVAGNATTLLLNYNSTAGTSGFLQLDNRM